MMSGKTFVNSNFIMTSEDEGGPKKRQRMSVVCLNCKARKIKCDKKRPSCSNCVKCNVGHLCRYEAPHWVNKVITAESKPETTLLPKIPPEPSLEPSTREDSLQDEIKRLKDRLQEVEKSLFEVNATKSQTKREFDDDYIHFYSSYNSLSIKRSGMEDQKPLCSSSFSKKDPFLALISGYFFLCETLYGAASRRRVRGDAKRLDNSLISILELLGEYDSPILAPIIKGLVDEKFNSKASKGSLFPLVSANHIMKPLAGDTLKKDIEALLPPKAIIRLYLKRFFKYVYPFYPIIQETFFTNRMMNKILKSIDENSPVELNIEDKNDFPFVATLMIALRFSYITMAKPLHPSEATLQHYPIHGGFIMAARTILSQFQVLRKANLQIVQSLLFLRIYLMLSPEDGDGPDFNHSQVLSSLIIQSAYTIGLNRDINANVRLNQTPTYINIWAKLWLSVLELDRIGSALSGQSCLIQNENSYQLRFPTPMETDSPYEQSIVKQMSLDQRLHSYFLDLTNMVNNLNTPTRITDVLGMIHQIEVYLALNFSMENLTVLTPQNNNVASYENIRKLKYNIMSKSISLLIYHSISIHFESKTHVNLEKHQHFQTLFIQTAIDLSNTLTEYLSEGYTRFIDPNFHFYLNTLVENSVYRVVRSLISCVARLYHTKQFLVDVLRTKDTSTIDTITALATLLIRVSNGLNSLLQRKLGRTYHQAFKHSIIHKYFLRSLHREGYKVISDTKQFLAYPSHQKNGMEKHLLDKMTNEQGFQATILVNLDNLNGFVQYDRAQFVTFLEIVKGSEVLKDPGISSEKSLWRAAFDDADVTTANTVSTTVPYEMERRFDGSASSGLTITPESDFQFDDVDGLAGAGLLSLDQILSADLLNLENTMPESVEKDGSIVDNLFTI